MLTEAEAGRRADRMRLELATIWQTRDAVTVGVTCETCTANAECPYAFDLYNTDGDCLAEK